MVVQISLWCKVFESFEYIPSGVISRSSSKCISSILKEITILFLHGGCANLQSTNTMWVFAFLHILISIYYSVFWILAVLTGEVISHWGFDLHLLWVLFWLGQCVHSDRELSCADVRVLRLLLMLSHAGQPAVGYGLLQCLGGRRTSIYNHFHLQACIILLNQSSYL